LGSKRGGIAAARIDDTKPEQPSSDGLVGSDFWN